LRDLELRHMPGLFFRHEERPTLIYPGKLVVSEARRDEMNRDRLKVNIAFTLPPGAYATLVTKRLFWFAMLTEEARDRGELHPLAQQALETAYGVGSIPKLPGVQMPKKRVPKPAPDAVPEEKPEPKKPMGFRERQRLKKEEKAARRESSEKRSAARDAAVRKAKAAGRKPKPTR
jgi:tRNA pseudouridine13 synthase